MKKLICIITILSLFLTGCSSANVNAENTTVSATPVAEENLYLVGQFIGTWDATEVFARNYYILENEQEFISPNSKMLINVILNLKEDGTYTIYTDSGQVLMALDMFLNEDNIKNMELNNLFHGDEDEWENYHNERDMTFYDIIEQMKTSPIVNILNFGEMGVFTISDNYIALNRGFAYIEYKDNTVKLTMDDDNLYTKTSTNYIKKG